MKKRNEEEGIVWEYKVINNVKKKKKMLLRRIIIIKERVKGNGKWMKEREKKKNINTYFEWNLTINWEQS